MENKKINITDKVFTSLKKPDTISISNDFRDEFFVPSNNPELLEIPIITYRIVFKIIADLRKVTFSSENKKNTIKNKMQLSLFDESMRTNHNTFSTFQYKISELDPNRSSKNVKTALEFLEQYQKGWHKQTNSAGKEINSFGGLISQPSYSEGEITFLVSSFWLEKLIDLNKFNPSLYDTLFKIKDPKQLLFYLWILRLGEKGTNIKFTTITEHYNLNYKTARELYINFVMPFKKKLDKISAMSFGSGVKGDYISFVKTPLVQTNNLKEKTITSLMIRQKVKYFRERHNLNENDLKIFSLYLAIKGNFEAVSDSYKTFVKDCREKKIKASDIVQEEFKTIFQSILLEKEKQQIWE
ncbi:hypothetical protein B0A67_24575 [Flavobacterium aquidurense]|uniref:hypothetical protein n=1 Tax=Flavobacterium aquidurense TaxID=362413 RepID=UPI00091EBD0C|nr:hypothetical protein [Flavobacterium aquidurense]OXA65310.1 hypothetical protein B0A67_24575 [Flavobacterium aquidurense]SHH88819.1 hypothetical protein SAMN05444481_14013 [Flavobacterium frigidimaris]